MELSDLWTIVLRRDGSPVVPFDANEHEDQGMLVYLTREAAEVAAEHQADLYEIDCEARRLDKALR